MKKRPTEFFRRDVFFIAAAREKNRRMREKGVKRFLCKMLHNPHIIC